MEQFKIRTDWRPAPPAPKKRKPGGPKPGDYVEMPEIPATRMFNELSFVGDEFVGCHVLETTEGFVLIDALWPEQRSVEIIERGLKDLGLDPANIKALLLTHGHRDHYGHGQYFQDKYGAKTYMSEADFIMAGNEETAKPFSVIPFKVDCFISDDEKFKIGDTVIDIVASPGHSQGCMSFFFEVTDGEEKHMAAITGNSSKPLEKENWEQYRDSRLAYEQECEKRNVEVELSSHPSIMNYKERLAICRNISPELPNPFVMPRDVCRKYEHREYLDACKAVEMRDKGLL